MRRVFLGALLLSLLVSPAGADATKTHTGLVKTKHFDVRYRPWSRAGAAVERQAVMAERDFADICAKLEFTPKSRLSLYLYDDVPELQRILSMQAGGASFPRESHVPIGNDQTRYHELCHIITYEMPKTGDEERNRFFPDGIANALLEYVHSIPVHAVPRYYRERKELPELRDLVTGNFYEWLQAHPGVNGYDIGASFFRFLIDEHGIAKTKRYYTGTPAKKAFGRDLHEVEKAWHGFLDDFQMRPEVRMVLAERHGHAIPPPAEVLGDPDDWNSLMDEELHPEQPGQWKRAGSAIVGTDPPGGNWTVCVLGEKEYASCLVRAKVRTRGVGGGVQLRLGNGCCAMLVANGTFVYRNDQPAGSTARKGVPQHGEVDLLMIRRRDVLQVWVDGVFMVEADVDGTPDPVGIAVNTGTAEFKDVRVRELD